MVNPLVLLWKDRCTIQITTPIVQANGADGFSWEPLVEDEPCKLSFYNNVRFNDTASEAGNASEVIQQVKIFIRPDLEIPAGSRVKIVTHENHRTMYYLSSSISSIFTNHQEITLENAQQWA